MTRVSALFFSFFPSRFKSKPILGLVALQFRNFRGTKRRKFTLPSPIYSRRKKTEGEEGEEGTRTMLCLSAGKCRGDALVVGRQVRLHEWMNDSAIPRSLLVG